MLKLSMSSFPKGLTIYYSRLSHDMHKNRPYVRGVVTEILLHHAAVLGVVDTGRLAFSDSGQPYLEKRPFYFSYTHTNDAVMLAISTGDQARVGIDAEPLSRASEIVALGNAAFSSRELKNNQTDALTRVWTTKEAALKMLGVGFSEADPNEYTVEAGGVRFSLLKGEAKVATGWTVSFINESQLVSICCSQAPTKIEFYARNSQTKEYDSFQIEALNAL